MSRKILENHEINLPYGLVAKFERVLNKYPSGNVIEFVNVDIYNDDECIFGESICRDELKG